MLKSCTGCFYVKALENFRLRTSNGLQSHVSVCKECERKYAKEYRNRNKEKISGYAKRYFKEINPGYSKKWKEKNSEKIRIRSKELYDKNRDKILCNKRKYRKEKREKETENQRLRRDNLRKSTIVNSQVPDIKEFYSKCPTGMSVDHIIPLKNKIVCGLHVLKNLQYLSPSDNSIKGSSFDGTYSNLSWRAKVGSAGESALVIYKS